MQLCMPDPKSFQRRSPTHGLGVFAADYMAPLSRNFEAPSPHRSTRITELLQQPQPALGMGMGMGYGMAPPQQSFPGMMPYQEVPTPIDAPVPPMGFPTGVVAPTPSSYYPTPSRTLYGAAESPSMRIPQQPRSPNRGDDDLGDVDAELMANIRNDKMVGSIRGTPSRADTMSESRRQRTPEIPVDQELYIEKQERKIHELLAETKNLKNQLARARSSLPKSKSKPGEEDLDLEKREAEIMMLKRRLREAERENRAMRLDQAYSDAEGASVNRLMTPKGAQSPYRLPGGYAGNSPAYPRSSSPIDPNYRPPWSGPGVGAGTKDNLMLETPVNKQRALMSIEKKMNKRFANVKPRVYNFVQETPTVRQLQQQQQELMMQKQQKGSSSSRSRSGPSGLRSTSPSASVSRKPISRNLPKQQLPEQQPGMMLLNFPFPSPPPADTVKMDSQHHAHPPYAPPLENSLKLVQSGTGSPIQAETRTYVAREYYVDPATGEKIEASNFETIAAKIQPPPELLAEIQRRNEIAIAQARARGGSAGSTPKSQAITPSEQRGQSPSFSGSVANGPSAVLPSVASCAAAPTSGIVSTAPPATTATAAITTTAKAEFIQLSPTPSPSRTTPPPRHPQHPQYPHHPHLYNQSSPSSHLQYPPHQHHAQQHTAPQPYPYVGDYADPDAPSSETF